jgi:hypothetical protein
MNLKKVTKQKDVCLFIQQEQVVLIGS